MNKTINKNDTILKAILIVVVLFMAIFVSTAIYLFILITPKNPDYYLNNFNQNINSYLGLNEVPVSELMIHAYDFNKNQFVKAFKTKPHFMPNVAKPNGDLPAFKIGQNIFVITRKWVNESSGILFTNNYTFVETIKQEHVNFKVKNIKPNVYTWFIDYEK